MTKIDDPFIKILPQIDLHGEDSMTSLVLVNEFINDNIKLKNKKIVLIHGKGIGILKKVIHEYLKNDKRVLEYKTDNLNDGITIVTLRG